MQSLFGAKALQTDNHTGQGQCKMQKSGHRSGQNPTDRLKDRYIFLNVLEKYIGEVLTLGIVLEGNLPTRYEDVF